MIPSLNNDNAYIMEEGHDDPVSLVKKAPGDYKLSEGDMKYLGWEGDTPPNLTREDINNMVKIDDCWVSVTRKSTQEINSPRLEHFINLYLNTTPSKPKL